MPTLAGRAVTPTGAKNPSRISGWPKVARSLASRMSAIMASSNPPPSAGPSTAITSGSSIVPSSAKRRPNAAIIPGACSGRCSPMSAPAEKARPSAEIATASTVRSAFARSRAAVSSSIIAMLRILSGGEARVMNATPSFTSNRTRPVPSVIGCSVPSGTLTPIDANHFAGDMSSARRAEEHDDGRDVFRFGNAPQC